MQEALQTTTVAQAHQSKLYGGVAKRKPLLNIAHLIMTRVTQRCRLIEGDAKELEIIEYEQFLLAILQEFPFSV